MEYYTNNNWTEYYREVDPDKRREIMETLFNEVEDDGANELRKSLFDKRHKPPKNAVKSVDNGIWHLIVVPANLSIRFRYLPGTRKEIQKAMDDMGVSGVDPSDEVAVSAVYWEIRNIARRYFATCESPKYGRKLFGMIAASDDEKLKKTAYFIWDCVEGIPSFFDMRSEMRIFIDAMKDEFFDNYEYGETVFLEVCEEKKHKKFFF